jgi:hypothetical protein
MAKSPGCPYGLGFRDLAQVGVNDGKTTNILQFLFESWNAGYCIYIYSFNSSRLAICEDYSLKDRELDNILHNSSIFNAKFLYPIDEDMSWDF